MRQIMLVTAGFVYIPEGFSRQLLNNTIILFPFIPNLNRQFRFIIIHFKIPAFFYIFSVLENRLQYKKLIF